MQYLKDTKSDIMAAACSLVHPFVTAIGAYQIVMLLNSVRKFLNNHTLKKLYGFDEKALNGKEWILVTGATSGVGRSIVDELVARKKGIVAVGRDQKKLDELVAYFLSVGHTKYKILKVDLSELTSVPAEAQKWVERFAELPNIDLVINNAGTSPKHRLVSAKYEDIVETFNTNVMSLLFITNGYLRRKLDTKDSTGHLMFISSGYSALPVPYSSCYPMNKHFGNMYYESLNRKLRIIKLNIGVTYVKLGRVITPLNIVMYREYQNAQNDKKKPRFSVLMPDTAARAILYQSLNEVESYGHPDHYLTSMIGEGLYGLFGRAILRPIAKAKLAMLLEMENEKEKQKSE